MGEINHKAKHCGSIKPSQWWRYRDDIFDLWPQGLAALHFFTEYINSPYPTITFELVYSESKLNVLDVTLHLVDGFIQTRNYYLLFNGPSWGFCKDSDMCDDSDALCGGPVAPWQLRHFCHQLNCSRSN